MSTNEASHKELGEKLPRNFYKAVTISSQLRT